MFPQAVRPSSLQILKVFKAAPTISQRQQRESTPAALGLFKNALRRKTIGEGVLASHANGSVNGLTVQQDKEEDRFPELRTTLLPVPVSRPPKKQNEDCMATLLAQCPDQEGVVASFAHLLVSSQPPIIYLA